MRAFRVGVAGLPVINKIDLASHVGTSLEAIDRDARKMRRHLIDAHATHPRGSHEHRHAHGGPHN
jgi:Ni2+-binding GTPase involved in maturation of urease and hydrogenase